MPQNDQTIDGLLEERLAELPRVVRDAITSSDVEDRLRKLADTHKLHLDQWQVLENEVMLTLLGVKHIEDLPANIKSGVGVSADVADALAESVSSGIFEPIRQELERQLEHPEAQEKKVSGVEAARDAALANAAAEKASTPAASAVQPATPPAAAPEVKVAKPAENPNYKPGETSAQRAAVHDDPYREAPL